MSPASSCFSFETSPTTSPLRIVELLHLGSWRVEDTTYLGRLFNLSAHSPLLDSHRAANHSSLRRPSSRASVPSASSPAEDVLVAKFVRAWESADLGALVALLTDDVFMSMPPMPFEYEGRDVVARFCGGLFGAGRRFDLVPTRANGQPAFGAYVRAPNGISHGAGLYVLAISGDRICAMTRFENSVLTWFGLPRSLPSR